MVLVAAACESRCRDAGCFPESLQGLEHGLCLRTGASSAASSPSRIAIGMRGCVLSVKP